MQPHLSPTALLLMVGGVHLLAVASPGPAFIMVSRAAVAGSRAAGIATALGVATGALVWMVAASVGLAAVLARTPSLQAALQFAGGGYLLWLGVQSWRHARAPMPEGAEPGVAAAFDGRGLFETWLRGLKSNLANPKVIFFFGSIFVTLFAPTTPLWVRIAALAIVLANEVGWWLLVAVAFAARPVQARYRRAKAGVDRVMGVVLGGFGVRLVAGALARLAA